MQTVWSSLTQINVMVVLMLVQTYQIAADLLSVFYTVHDFLSPLSDQRVY